MDIFEVLKAISKRKKAVRDSKINLTQGRSYLSGCAKVFYIRWT